MLYVHVLQMTGFLNYDVWNWIVGYLVDDMRIVREFPLHPDVSTCPEGQRVSVTHSPRTPASKHVIVQWNVQRASMCV